MVANETKQSQELAKRLWAIANDLRGNMNAAKFQNYILGVIFYRYLSEHTENYMDDLLKNDGISYQEALADPDYTETVKEWSLEHLGYIMEPKNLWGALIDSIKAGQFSIEDFEKAINALVGSTVGQDSEAAFYKLFDDMNLQDKDLGREVSGRTELISKVMLRVNDIPFGVTEAEIDVLGTAYMYLIALFADDDRISVAPDHRIVPDSAVFSDRHISQHHCSGRYKCCIMDLHIYFLLCTFIYSLQSAHRI